MAKIAVAPVGAAPRRECLQYLRSVGAAPTKPSDLYGPGDNYHPQNSHVIPAMIRRFHEAKVNNAPSVAIWGTGAVLPFLAILTDPARVFAHPSAQPIIQALGLTEPKQLLLPLTIAFGSRVSTREIISL